MDIILLQDVEGLGKKFETVTVKNGYGRNYLIPQKKAVIANKMNKSTVGERLRQINAKAQKAFEAIKQLAEKIKSQPITVGAKTGSTDKIFGSVTNVQLADAIKRQAGVEVDRRKITIVDEVKTLGTYKAVIHLREDLKQEINFEVVAE